MTTWATANLQPGQNSRSIITEFFEREESSPPFSAGAGFGLLLFFAGVIRSVHKQGFFAKGRNHQTIFFICRICKFYIGTVVLPLSLPSKSLFKQ
jgi:hypothetical protein